MLHFKAHNGHAACNKLSHNIALTDDWSKVRCPLCAYDEIGDIMELDNTGLTEEYDPEEFEPDDFNDGFDFNDDRPDDELNP